MIKPNQTIIPEIASVLSSAYENIYYINTQDISYAEYSFANDTYSATVVTHGENFFEQIGQGITSNISKDDAEKFSEFFNYTKIIAILQNEREFTLPYKIAIGNQAFFKEMRFFKTADKSHLICGILAVKKQTEYLMDLAEERIISRYDVLTDLLNRYAFDDRKHTIDVKIASGEAQEFAVVVCDVNNLKKCNDTIGHKAGDQLIIDAACFISEVFSHSHVYRIGGDEFVAILERADYQNRHDLIAKLNRQSTSYKSGTNLVVAAGIADFEPSNDKSVDDVFKRADKLMYVNKIELKKKQQ